MPPGEQRAQSLLFCRFSWTSKGKSVHLDDDSEAIRRCQQGDIGGLEPLIARYQVASLRLAYLLVGERAAAEDVVQDSFLFAYQGIARFHSGSAFAPWFFRIVTNTARQTHRRAASRREVTVNWQISSDEDTYNTASAGTVGVPRDRDPQVDPALRAERQEERADVLRALGGLTQKQREAVVLRYYFGCSDQELATILGCREVTARQRLYGGLATLRQIISQRFAWLGADNTPSRARQGR
jgi:RNA polymerase sigma-70 factor (ECF subfamily)